MFGKMSTEGKITTRRVPERKPLTPEQRAVFARVRATLRQQLRDLLPKVGHHRPYLEEVLQRKSSLRELASFIELAQQAAQWNAGPRPTAESEAKDRRDLFGNGS